MMIELRSDMKKFIFLIACEKLSHVNSTGHASGFVRISMFGLKALRNTRMNGMT